MSYHNTTNERGQTLMQFRDRAAKQDEEVLAIVRRLLRASPSQVWDAMKRSCPITSVRRSMTNLTVAGKLFKTETKVTGTYGRNEHVWIPAA